MKTNSIIGGLGIITLGLALGLSAHGGTVYVATNATPAAPYDTWAGAFTNVQDALDFAADSGGTTTNILLAGHTFWLTNQVEWTTAGLTISGGYDPDSGNHDPEAWPTVLARSGAGGTHRIMFIDGADNGTLAYVTIRDGYSHRDDPGVRNGAGLYIANSDPLTLIGCAIIDNTRSGEHTLGVGIYATGSNVTLTNCLVRGNLGSPSTNRRAEGGGIWSNGQLTLRDTRIVENRVISPDRTAHGAGIWFEGTSLEMKNVLVTHNYPHRYHEVGGIWIASGTVNMKNCTVAHNAGTGIHRGGGTVNLFDCIVWGNGEDIVNTVNVSFSNVGDTDYGDNNISADPLFEYGYYLGSDSPSTNAGSATAASLGLASYAKNTAGDPYGAGDTVNMGYHYPTGFDILYPDLYVATDGDDDENDGKSEEEAFQTLTHALSLAHHGTRIHVATGVYSMATTGEEFPLNIESMTGVRILGAGMDETIIDASDADTRVVTLKYASATEISDVTLTGGDLSGDSPTFNPNYGGGLLVHASQEVVLTRCGLRDNQLTRQHSLGGGLGAFLSEVRMEHCLVRDNSAIITQNNRFSYGGGIWADGKLTIYNSRTLDNSVVEDGNRRPRGGGIWFGGTELVMRNILVAGNDSQESSNSAIWLNSGATSIENCTVADNPQGGIRREGGTVNLLNTIVWDNADGDIIGVVHAAHSLYGTGADVEDEGDNIVGEDPLFETDAGDYRLQKGSPAVDSGLNQAWMMDAVDLDGRPRILMGTVDRGCYETIPPAGTLILLQ